MSYWKFVCTCGTEGECMIRRLFGNNSDTTEERDLIDVRQHDTLYFHQMMTKDSDRHGYLLGPFVTAGSAKMNIEPNAWSHIGTIDWQVEVDWTETVYSLNLDDWLANRDPPLEITQYAQEYNEVQGTYLSGQLKNKSNVVTDYP